jgi:hypothetical protein
MKEGVERNTYKILAGKPEGKRSLGRARCWCEADVKMNFK